MQVALDLVVVLLLALPIILITAMRVGAREIAEFHAAADKLAFLLSRGRLEQIAIPDSAKYITAPFDEPAGALQLNSNMTVEIIYWRGLAEDGKTLIEFMAFMFNSDRIGHHATFVDGEAYGLREARRVIPGAGKACHQVEGALGRVRQALGY